MSLSSRPAGSLSAEIPALSPEKIMLPMDSRIVYEEDTGKWRVLYQGQFVKQTFKTAKDATDHLLSLREHRVKPEWSK